MTMSQAPAVVPAQARQQPIGPTHAVAPDWRDRYRRRYQEICDQRGYEVPLQILVSVQRHIIEMWTAEPFYTRVSMYIRKVINVNQPTLYVTLARDGVFEVHYNPIFLVDLPPEEIRGAFKHEIAHIFLGHLTQRVLQPQVPANIGMDAAIDSMMDHSTGGENATCRTPRMAVLPGRAMHLDPEDRCWLMSSDPIRYNALMVVSDLYVRWPKLQSSEWYFNSLNECITGIGKAHALNGEDPYVKGLQVLGWEAPPGAGAGTIMPGTFDGHGEPGKVDNDDERVDRATESLLRRVEDEIIAEGTGWGSMSSEMLNKIRARYRRAVDWTNVLRYFVGTSQVLHSRRTLVKRDRRVPMVYPGKRKTRTARILVFVDQSGSVSDVSLALLFGELEFGLSDHVTFDVVPFESWVCDSELFTWRKGSRVTMDRTHCGGTSFDACVQWLDDPSVRDERHRSTVYDAAMIMTDGECSDPGLPQSCRLAYVIVPGKSLMFATQAMVINMDERANENVPVL